MADRPDLLRMRQQLDATSPGPWTAEVRGGEDLHFGWFTTSHLRFGPDGPEICPMGWRQDDAAWIADAHEDMRALIDWLNGQTQATETVEYYASRLLSAETIRDQADAALALANAVSDLRTWLPGYDDRSGTLPYERDESDQDYDSPG